MRAKKEPEKMAVIKPKVYIETTVVSYFTARPSRDLLIAGHQEATREVWPRLLEEFDPYISALVLQEAGRGDAQAAKERLAAIQTIPVLDINPLSQTLAAQLVYQHGIPQEYPEDALHIAVATIHGMDILVTWNFSHINNPFTRARVRHILEQEGYQAPEICSPEELSGVTV